MFILHLLRNSHLRTMTFCFIYFSFIFGISCKDLTTQHALTTTPTQSSTIEPTGTSKPSFTQDSVPKPIKRTFPSSSTTTSLQHSNTCAITFYSENSYKGEALEINNPNGDSNLHMNEKSAQTFGTCCWKIYRYLWTNNDIKFLMLILYFILIQFRET